MNQIDQNINKDMIESDLIDVESMDFSNDQTWLYVAPHNSGVMVDILDLSCDWPILEDEEYKQLEQKLNALLDDILKNQVPRMPDKHIFDSRTYVRPKKRAQRPSIQNIIEVSSNNSPHINPLNQTNNRYMTYNKYSMPLGPISPMIRLKTFNVDVNTDNSHSIKEYSMRRQSLLHDDDPQLEDLVIQSPGGLFSENTSTPTKPINIDLSQPAHNLLNTFNKGLTNTMHERESLNMYQSGDSLMRMSPPSLIYSQMMESSGNFNGESLDGQKSISSVPRDLGRDNVDPMATSMSLSIIDEKDMNTSFLSQTTYPDNDSLMNSMPPSLVSSANSSYIVSNTTKSKAENTPDSNIFNSMTFTNLEKSEKLLPGRPRCQLFNTFTKRESAIRNSESYTKSREEACQFDTTKILNENGDKKDIHKSTFESNPGMAETITLHYSNTKFRCGNDSEKENHNATFEIDDSFYKDTEMHRTTKTGRISLDVTYDKKELNEIIQARQKLSLARKSLPSKMPNQEDLMETIQLPNQIIKVPKKSMDNASELLAKRRTINGGLDKYEESTGEILKKNNTFTKASPKSRIMNETMVIVTPDKSPNIIDINSATYLADTDEKTSPEEEYSEHERAMIVTSESIDMGTCCSSTTVETEYRKSTGTSTPITEHEIGGLIDLLEYTASPIEDTFTPPKEVPSQSTTASSGDTKNSTVIISPAMVKIPSTKRDSGGRMSPEKRSLVVTQIRSPCQSALKNSGPAPAVEAPRKSSLPTSKLRQHGSHKELSTIPGIQSGISNPVAGPRKTGLPTSKSRQYSSHKELSGIPGNAPFGIPRRSALADQKLVRPNVYASNPVLSAAPSVPPTRCETRLANVSSRESYTVTTEPALINMQTKKRPALVRQAYETLRRERPLSQLVALRDHQQRAAGSASPTKTVARSYISSSSATQRYTTVAAVQPLQSSRPTSVPSQRPVPAPVVANEQRPMSSADSPTRASALPRPSRLPGPKRIVRQPEPDDSDHY